MFCYIRGAKGTAMIVGPELAACLICFLYSSLFEWFGHRNFMHARRYPLGALFEAHVRIHHRVYRRETYQTVERHPRDVTLGTSSYPCILVGHMPAFYLAQRLMHLPVFWGAVAGGTLYYI